MSVKKVTRSGNRVVFDEEDTHIEDKVTGEKIWATDDGGMFMVKMWVNGKACFLRQEKRAGESTGSIRPVGMEVDKPEEEDAFKFDDEDPRRSKCS